MPLEMTVQMTGLRLGEVVERRVRRHLGRLERRLAHRPAPSAVLVLRERRPQPQVEADLRVQLEPLGALLVSHQVAETPERAARQAVEDMERQLERHAASQRREHTYGVPSRRLPEHLRPNPPPEGRPADDARTAMD